MPVSALADFVAPTIDYHALAPEIVLAVGLVTVLVIDLFVTERRRWITGTVTGMVLLASTVTRSQIAAMFYDLGLTHEEQQYRHLIQFGHRLAQEIHRGEFHRVAGFLVLNEVAKLFVAIAFTDLGLHRDRLLGEA